MPGPEFFQTPMGRTFYDATMPRIAKALERIADALDAKAKAHPIADATSASEAGPHRRKLLGCAEDVWHVLRDRIPAEQEAFFVIAIDVRNGLLGDPLMVGLGHVHGVEVHPREVFREAVRQAAAGIVVAHNHPSGDPTPSEEDIALTRRLRAIGDIIGIPVIDHVVLTRDKFRSIAEYVGSEL